MLSPPPSVRLLVATQPVDGRKGPDSLMALVRDVTSERLPSVAIEAAELALIVEGIDLEEARRRARWQPAALAP